MLGGFVSVYANYARFGWGRELLQSDRGGERGMWVRSKGLNRRCSDRAGNLHRLWRQQRTVNCEVRESDKESAVDTGSGSGGACRNGAFRS